MLLLLVNDCDSVVNDTLLILLKNLDISRREPQNVPVLVNRSSETVRDTDAVGTEERELLFSSEDKLVLVYPLSGQILHLIVRRRQDYGHLGEALDVVLKESVVDFVLDDNFRVLALENLHRVALEKVQEEV